MSEPSRPSRPKRHVLAAGLFVVVASAVALVWALSRDEAPAAPPASPGVISPRGADAP